MEHVHSRQRFNRQLFHDSRRGRLCGVALYSTRGVIKPLYHCRHSARDRQYDGDRVE